MKKRVWCSFQIEGLHQAPAELKLPESYLHFPHRHLFHCRVEWDVEGDNREIEFIAHRRSAYLVTAELMADLFPYYSCEQLAAAIMDRTGAQRVEVSEDGENGAYVEA